MLEDGVKHRVGTLHEPLNMLVDLAVYVGQEEKLLVSLDHENEEMHGTEFVLRSCRDRASTGTVLPGSALAFEGPLDWEINKEMALAHSFLLRRSE